MSDIFISYSSKDRDAAERVHDALTEAGYDVFWDREVPPGQDWDSWIRGELNAARLVIVLWTRAGVASPNVRHEAIIAREAGKLLPVIAEDLKPSDFPMGLFHVQTLDLGRDSDDFEAMREQFLVEVAEQLTGGGRSSGARAGAAAANMWHRRWLAPAATLVLLAILVTALIIAWPSLSFDPDAPPLSTAELQAAADREVPARGRVVQAATRFLATDSSDLSSSWVWGVAQGIAGAPDEERLLTVRFFQRLESAQQPGCNCYFSYSVPLTIPHAWVVAASARLRRAPPEPLVEVLLNAQSQDGWWAITLDATPERANAAVHPTALVAIALAEARRAGVVPQPLRRRVDDALRRAAAWLNQGPAEGAQWADYPHNAQPTRNLMFAAMASQRARLAGGPADGNAARPSPPPSSICPGLSIRLHPAPMSRGRTGRAISTTTPPRRALDRVRRHARLSGADTATKRRLRPLIRRWFEADLSDPRLPNYEWITGETLFLRALARREIGGCRLGREAVLQRDLGVEQLGDRAIGLCVGGDCGETLRVDPRHMRFQHQVRTADLEAVAVLVELDRRPGSEGAVAQSFAGQREAERHRETGGVGGGDQLFRIGPGPIFETRVEAIGIVAEHAGLGRNLALPLLAEAFIGC